MEEKTPETDEAKKSPDPFKTGTTQLLVGGGIGAYGVTLATTVGYVCPICVIAAPAFLGWGGVQKYLYHKKNSAKADLAADQEE